MIKCTKLQLFEIQVPVVVNPPSSRISNKCDLPDTTGKSPKSCPAPREKIFPLRRRANHFYNSARLTRHEGRWPSSRTRVEMRWTRQRRHARRLQGGLCL